VLVVGAAGCGSGGGTPSAGAATTGVATTPAVAALTILVSNDDGVTAPGIDAVVNALRALPDVTVDVVAPATNESGTGAKRSATTPPHQPARTASGVAATAVDGYPTDSVDVALDVLGLKPDLVVSGINLGQNLGPFVDLSGTVGAARAAAVHGIPAIATSFGLGKTYDFAPAASLVATWVAAHRAQFAGHGAGAALSTIMNLNVPNCATGVVRGEKELPTEPKVANLATALTNNQDCASTATPTDEVGAFNDGFATVTTIPATPAS
jgi:5'-nucleotidase